MVLFNEYLITPTRMNDAFHALQKQIKAELSLSYETGTLRLEELLAILYILGQAEDEKVLAFLVRGFSDSFSVLKHFVQTEDDESKREFEAEIQKLVSKLLKTDPAKAVDLAKESMQPGASIAGLKNKYNLN